MAEKKLVKIEKDTPGRLQSLKLPRDLSLGISKSKKQYAPNLNVIRNKDKTKEILKKNDQKRKGRTPRDRPDKNTQKDRFIQSAGVFSEGTADLKRISSSNHEKRVSFRDSSSVSNIIMPKINRNTWNVNKKAEDVVLEEIMNCEIDSDDEKSSFKPLTLTVDKEDPTMTVKKESSHPSAVDSYVPAPFNLNSEEIGEANATISMVRLPDSFAGKGLSDDPNIKKLFDYPLSGMLEGRIGKLIIRKSGRIEAEIGRIKYELNVDTTFQSREEIAAIVKTGDDSDETAIAVLGKVLNNFVMYPDYGELLKKK